MFSERNSCHFCSSSPSDSYWSFLRQVHSFIPQCGQIVLIFCKCSNYFVYLGSSFATNSGCVLLYAFVNSLFLSVNVFSSHNWTLASSTFYGFEFSYWIIWWICVYATLFCLPFAFGPCGGKYGLLVSKGSFLSWSNSFFLLFTFFYWYKGKEWGL